MNHIALAMLALICAGCSTVNSSIDGQYDGPNGATLKLAQTKYEFCNVTCSGGLMEVRSTGKRAGRVTFFGVPIAAYFRSAQRGANGTSLRTWGEGVETGYRLGSFGAAIDIDPQHGLAFKRRR